MKTRIIGAIVALVLAAIGAFLLVDYVRTADARAAAGTELSEVYVVQTVIPEGTAGEAMAEFVDVDTLPTRNLAEGHVSDLDELAGLVSDAQILPGEQLLEARFIDPSTLAARGDVPTPAGMQLVSFTIPAERAAAGAIRSGDEVGMVATFDRGDGGGVQSQFAFHDVLVTTVEGLAVTEEGETASEQAAGTTLMVTIALGTHDIERWVWAVDGNASVWLTLENDATDNGGSAPADQGNLIQ